jgi:hypothetical protein
MSGTGGGEEEFFEGESEEELGDEVSEVVGRLRANESGLVELDLRGYRLESLAGGRGGEEIGEALAVNTTLTRFNLDVFWGNILGREGARAGNSAGAGLEYHPYAARPW